MSHPPFWLDTLHTVLEEASLIPQWESGFHFSIEQFASVLSARFSQELKVKISRTEWLEADEVTHGLGENPSVQAIDVGPFGASVFLFSPQEDILALSKWLLTEKKQQEGLLDERVRRGFFTFTLLTAIDAFVETCSTPLSPRIGSQKLPQEPCLSFDIQLKKGRSVASFRLIVPKTFQTAMNTFLATGHPDMSDFDYPDIPLPLGIECGMVQLSQEALQKVKKGDFIILDHASFFPETKKGICRLTLSGKTLFQIKIKEDHISVLDYPIDFQEDPMDDEVDIDEPEAVATPKKEALVDAKTVDLELSVELGKIQMSLHDLMKLTPGNVVETTLNPSKPVHLTLNGKPVARGQLTQIGDVIGVHISDLAKK